MLYFVSLSYKSSFVLHILNFFVVLMHGIKCKLVERKTLMFYYVIFLYAHTLWFATNSR